MLRLKGTLPALLRAWEYALDTVAPPDPTVRAVERAGAEGFAARAKRSEEYGAIALFPYSDERVRAAIVEIKTYLNRRLVEVLAAGALEGLKREVAALGIPPSGPRPLLVPVPMTKRSVRERGWNQCELVAREMARIDGGATFELAIGAMAKVRQTGDQVGKGREERAKNLEGCFRASGRPAMEGRAVVVFDDVLTTGATLAEARGAARAAGAERVVCVALAH